MKELDIGEVCRQARVQPSALRFYEQKGLIHTIGRKGLRRQYAASVLDRLALIALGQSAGFSLDEVALMFGAEGQLQIDKAVLAAKTDELDRTIQRLGAMRDGLRHAAVCPAPSHAQCPSFQRYMRAAASGQLAAGGRRKSRPP